ncbi:MAG: tRNA (5-methylaminomethyl-2-thiouridine)(34)-methyltransferase MnmD [Cyclobacteriaceae bacterium]
MLEIIKTKDGSHSLLVPEMNETYHSTHGALTESQYVFIEKGLAYFHEKFTNQKTIHVLEAGFGTGLNALLTFLYATEHDLDVVYHSLETNPIDSGIVSQLNYHEQLAYPKAKETYEMLHQAEWNKPVRISGNFSLQKIKQPLQEYESMANQVDVVYYDAFAPSRQPDMWQPELYAKLYKLMKSNGIFVTYCAQGQFKRDLKATGFEVEKLPGPPGKAEMTRGEKVI